VLSLFFCNVPQVKNNSFLYILNIKLCDASNIEKVLIWIIGIIVSLLHQITIKSAVHLYKFTKNVKTTYQITIFLLFYHVLKTNTNMQNYSLKNIFSKLK